MLRRNFTALALALALAPLTAGCPLTPDIEFDVEVEQDVAVDGTTTTIDKTAEVDLYAKVPNLKKYRSKIQAISIKKVAATIVAINPSNASTTLTGKILVGGVEIGSAAGVPVAVGTTATATTSAALNKAILDAVKNDGKLSVAIQGSTDTSPIDFAIEVQLEGEGIAEPL